MFPYVPLLIAVLFLALVVFNRLGLTVRVLFKQVTLTRSQSLFFLLPTFISLVGYEGAHSRIDTDNVVQLVLLLARSSRAP